MGVADGASQLAPWGFPYTFDPTMPRGTDSVTPGANLARYYRVLHGGKITKIGLEIATSAGNIDVGAYRNSGVGRAAVPGARLASSGSTASPGTGYREITLGATAVLQPGDWLAICADGASFAANAILSSGVASDLALGRALQQGTAFPLPDTPASLTAFRGVNIVLVGI